jgi:hypothetical protein
MFIMSEEISSYLRARISCPQDDLHLETFLPWDPQVAKKKKENEGAHGFVHEENSTIVG